MVTLYTGMNGQGKTVLLYRMMDTLACTGKSFVSNIASGEYLGFDESRLEIVSSWECVETIFDYREVYVSNNQLAVESENGEAPYTNYFLRLLSLICRKGDYLLLDEPEFGLRDMEAINMASLIQRLLPTYRDVYITTHCSRFFYLADKVLWVKGYESKEISKDELYERIGAF